MSEPRKVLLTGATGFVGSHVRAALDRDRWEVRCGTRRPDKARARHPDERWVYLDVNDPSAIAEALDGCDSALYLVHAMSGGEGYEEREAASARAFAAAAREAGLRRLVYLGGVAPQGEPSPHLRSRLQTGELLREGFGGAIELRAGMIIGPGSESWQICRDLAARLPFMVLPRWLRSRSRPVAIDDVVAALTHALQVEVETPAVFDIPGPDTLESAEILFRIAALLGMKTRSIRVPVVSPRLSSYWLGLVTRADPTVARELVEGLICDLLPTREIYWERMPGYTPRDFDDAARDALEKEQPPSFRTRLLERVARGLAATDPSS